MATWQDFYVYAVLRNGIAYIGKGRDGRAIQLVLNHAGNGVVFFAHDLEEQDAFRLERRLIATLHPPDNIIYNR